MLEKLRSKIILEFHDSISDAEEAAWEGLVPTMVEQFERNIVDFLQGEFASDNPFRKEVGIGNIDDDGIHVPNVVEFQEMIKNLQRLNALARQRFD